MDTSNIKEIIKEKYGQAALRVKSGAGSRCCGTSAAEELGGDPITSNLYHAAQADQIPEEARLASLGCGNPTALANLNAGEVVLDLGSGGGIDVLLSARRVGPSGKAYGLDMTDEMLSLANENKRNAGAENVEFFKGEIEHIPLPDNSVDVILSNCVINLSADKNRVFQEAFRVLKPGGPFAVSTSFANPAVTIARWLTNAFAGIRPIDVPLFVLAQLAGGLGATLLFRWSVPTLPSLAKNVVLQARN